MAMAHWTWDTALRGVIPPMISPLTSAQQVDGAAVKRLVDYILDGGCSGLFVLGGTGEGAWLTWSQREAIVRSTVQAANGRAPVLVGVMLPGTAPARDSALQAVDAGADALVVGSPYYFAVEATAQLRHIEAILAATSLPVVLYNIPQCTHQPIAREAIEALASEPRMLGIKDSSGDLPYFQFLLSIKRARPAFRVLQGLESAAAPSLLVGADGLIPGLANVAPRLLSDLVRAAHAGHVHTCGELQEQVVDLAGIYSGGLAALYAACALLGLSENVPAEPWGPIDAADQQSIAAILERHGLLRTPVASSR